MSFDISKTEDPSKKWGEKKYGDIGGGASVGQARALSRNRPEEVGRVFRVSQAVRERAEALANKANQPVGRLRFEAIYGVGLRVIVDTTPPRCILGVLPARLVSNEAGDGVWELLENVPDTALRSSHSVGAGKGVRHQSHRGRHVI